MKTYTGTKIVKALAMSRQAYNDYRGWQLPVDENGADEGYLVEYQDGGKPNDSRHAGYISWSPKAQFEQAYLAMDVPAGTPPHVVRMIGEKAELQDRLTKLEKFIGTPIYNGLASDEQLRLGVQRDAMRMYLNVLAARVASALRG